MARKKKRMKKWPWILLLLIGGGVAFALLNPKQDEGIVPVTVAEAERRTIVSTVSATGKIFPEVEVKITSEVAGEILEIAVEEGDLVSRGAMLARINPDTLESQVRRQEAAIKTARARAAQSEIAMRQAERDYERLRDLHDQEFISEDELENAETRMRELQANFEAARSRIQEAEMLLTEARDKLDRATIYAPMDGTISVMAAEVGERVVGTGQFEGTEIMRVADLENMEVRIEVSETDIVNVSVGDVARVEVDALPNDVFPGEVTEIASSAKIANAGSQEQTTTFEVRIKINKLDPRLRPGMTATADIETDTAVDVVSVPLQSVTVRDKELVAEVLGNDLSEEEAARVEARKRREEMQRRNDSRRRDRNFSMRAARDRLQRIVFVKNGEKVLMRKVETGIADNAYIEIKAGLEPGEEVVSGSYTAITRLLAHESPVRIEEDRRGAGGRPGGRSGG